MKAKGVGLETSCRCEERHHLSNALLFSSVVFILVSYKSPLAHVFLEESHDVCVSLHDVWLSRHESTFINRLFEAIVNLDIA